ncbi:MAG TPA: TlpA disulfide reductase family protein [Aquaticitalea sp.]|nr:TlpA disulfide reductase family protein [Aquaticitalea sp.]
MKITKSQRNNTILLVIILVMIVPQTRQPLQILLHKGLALFSPSIVEKDKQIKLTDYNWRLMDENGTPFDFNDAKGKVVIVNFWATWCPPCIAEMPSLEKLYHDYKKEVVFLLVSNESPEVISSFKEKNTYDILVYSSLNSSPKFFDMSSIPRTYVIDRFGNIVIDKSGAADWNSRKVRDLLTSLLKTSDENIL